MSTISQSQSFQTGRQDRLIQGVREGTINRAEFDHLNLVDNEVAFQTGWGTDGFQPSDNTNKALEPVLREFHDLYEKYRRGNFSPTVVAQSPVQQVALQQGQSIYKAIHFGTNDRNFGSPESQSEHNRVARLALSEQREILSQTGQYVRRDGWNPSLSESVVRRFERSIAAEY